MKIIPEGTPVICESPALRNFAEPGVFVIMTSDVIHKHKDISHLKALPHVMFQLEELDKIDKFHWNSEMDSGSRKPSLREAACAG